MEPLVDDSNNVFDQFGVIIDSLSHFRIQVNTIQQQIRQLEKNIKSINFFVYKRKNSLFEYSILIQFNLSKLIASLAE